MTGELLSVESFAQAGLAMMSVGIILCFLRFALGPSTPDRVIALDAIATLLIGSLVLHGIVEADTESLRVATVLALTNFLGTVAFSIHIRREPSKKAPAGGTSK